MAWSSLALFTTFAIILGLVIALPVETNITTASGFEESSTLNARAPKLAFPRIVIEPDAKKWAKMADFQKAFAKDIYKRKAFWTGNRFDESRRKRTSILGEVVALLRASSKKPYTIEMALEKEELKMPRFDIKMEAKGSEIWTQAMEAWSHAASGEITVYEGEKRDGNSFETIELPILMGKKDVPSITATNLITKKKTVLKGSGGGGGDDDDGEDDGGGNGGGNGEGSSTHNARDTEQNVGNSGYNATHSQYKRSNVHILKRMPATAGDDVEHCETWHPRCY